jgi:2-polyprenyl-6-methoxyphenol hydroxylase-like FAD-dependent oxidoreductase
MKPEIEVLIVGAGPTGLVLALWLSHLGVKHCRQGGRAGHDLASAGGGRILALEMAYRDLLKLQQLGGWKTLSLVSRIRSCE